MTKTNAKSAPRPDCPTPNNSQSPTIPRRASRKHVAIAPATSAPIGKISKLDQLAGMLLRNKGANLNQMIALTGWLPHTTRAALTGLRKKGYSIDSDKVDGLRTYRAVAPK